MEENPVQFPQPNPFEQSPQVPPVSLAPKINWLISLLFLVVGVAIGSLGLWAYQNYLPAAIQESPSPSPTADPTASWETYRGDIFEYMYPGDLYLVEDNPLDSIKLYKDKAVADSVESCLKETPAKPCDYPLITVEISQYKVSDYESVDELILKNQIEPLNPVNFVTTGGLNFTSEKEATGGLGASAYQRAFTREGGIFTVIQINTTPVGTDSAYFKGQEWETINQILSTFKFAEPEVNPKACTMEAKLCPDGSYVGREGPNCEFAPCPTP